MMTGSGKCCLSAVSLGFALGLVCAIFAFLLALASWWWGFGTILVQQSATVYYGYEPSLMGGIIGALWAFIHCFIFGLLTGWFYNMFLCCCKSKCGTCGTE